MPLTGYCNPANDTASHARCSGAYSRGPAFPDLVACGCDCHQPEGSPMSEIATEAVRITEPGIYYDLPNETYHAQTDWLGSSQLKHHVPEFYSPPTGRDALDVGTALHAKVLGTDEVVRVLNFASWRSKAAEDARAAADAAGEVPILAADAERIEGMAAAIRNHADASRLLYDLPGKSEVSIFARDPEGRQIKARPDRLLDGVIVDLKSTRNKPGARSTAMTCVDLGYDLSAAHYLDVAECAGLGALTFAFVVVAKTPPYYVTVAQLSDELLADGWAIRDTALRRATNQAAAYQGATGYLTLDRPYRREIPA